jgi:hypothetical protein
VGFGAFGNEPMAKFFPYRSSSYITRFFRDADTDYAHDGSTRRNWVASVLAEILNEPHPDAQTPPDAFCRVIRVLMGPADAKDEPPDRPGALKALNVSLNREGFEAFYADDNQCYLRHIDTNTIVGPATNPHRPLSRLEVERRDQLIKYLDDASEDDLINQVLLPLLRQLDSTRSRPLVIRIRRSNTATTFG